MNREKAQIASKKEIVTSPENQFGLEGNYVLVDFVKYTGEYPDMPEFQQPLDNCVIVTTDEVKFSLDKPLESEAFGPCFAIIVKNPSGNGGLFHSRDLIFNKLEQKEEFKSKLETGAVMVAVRGGISRPSELLRDELKKMGVEDKGELKVGSTGSVHFSVMYKPKEDRFYVDDRNSKTLLIFEGPGKL